MVTIDDLEVMNTMQLAKLVDETPNVSERFVDENGRIMDVIDAYCEDCRETRPMDYLDTVNKTGVRDLYQCTGCTTITHHTTLRLGEHRGEYLEKAFQLIKNENN